MSKTENVNELVKMLNEIGVLGDKKILKADLLNPSPLFAQEIFYSFLPEFGMSEGMLEVPKLLVDTSQIPNHELLAINVVCQKFFRSINCTEMNFGLSDLTQPDGVRLRRFLFIMANFWIFCNHNYPQVDEVEKRVEENTQWSKGILSDINKNLKKRDDLRVQLEKMKIYNEQKQKDIEASETELNQAKSDYALITETAQDVKERLRLAVSEKEEVEASADNHEAEKKRLQTLVQADQTKQAMEKDLRQLKKDHESKELEIQRIKRDLQDMSLRVEEFRKLEVDLKSLSELRDRVRAAETKVQQQTLEKQEATSVKNSLSEEFHKIQAELKTTETEMGKAMSEWNQRRTCLEASVKDYRQEIEETRRGKSQDEIVASDREQEIGKFTLELHALEEEMADHESHNAALIRGMLEKYKKFEAEVKDAMETKLRKAYEKLEKQ